MRDRPSWDWIDVALILATISVLTLVGGNSSVSCRPNTTCSDSLLAMREDLKCVAAFIPDSSWHHVLGVTYAAYPPNGCGIVYRTNGEITVQRRGKP